MINNKKATFACTRNKRNQTDDEISQKSEVGRDGENRREIAADSKTGEKIGLRKEGRQKYARLRQE